MKIFKRIINVLLVACVAVGCLVFTSCTQKEVDYVESLKLDLSSETVKQEVKVRLYVDGDTTHFDPVKDSQITPLHDFSKTQNVIKARYIAINTPESTGRIEEWGKGASKFTRSKLEKAKSIIVESDNDKWNIDSTGSRYVVWIWYMPEDGTEYRNLNLEILQNGYALASSTANNRYGKIAMDALNQAKSLKYHVYSGEKDPDFFYGDIQELTLKELRSNIESYNGTKVSFEGIVTCEVDNTVYIEELDLDTGVYVGMTIYYGFGASSDILEAFRIGNRVRIVGTVSYYEAGGTYQVSGLSYDFMNPSDPNNTVVVSEGHSPSFAKVEPATFVNGTVVFDDGPDAKKFKYGEAVMSSSISMDGLTVYKVYTTSNGGSNDGAMTLSCRASDGTLITVRTSVLYEDGELVTYEKYMGKTINVKGIVDYYDGNYQIYSYRTNYITVVD